MKQVARASFSFGILLAWICAAMPVGAATTGDSSYRPIAGAAPDPLPATGPTSREEVEAFIDGTLAIQLRDKQIAGASVVVVKDGQVLFVKGYGYEDVEKRVPVDPELTLFRAGSISKLFTWTAVMQLVEKGTLDLDTDVNTYLKDLQIPATFAQPITLRNLMTHTAGLEDGGIGYLFSKDQKDLTDPGTWLKAHMPARIRPPTTDFSSGSNASYSNWGAALTGHIVATVAGMPYDEYVERNILGPLGMTRSTFREPLPPELAERLSGGYAFKDGRFTRTGFEFMHNVGPAGSLSTTATDMAKFMLAHLGPDVAGGGRILNPETTRLMHTRTLSLDPAMNGIALGFVEAWVNGRRVIGHNGDTIYFHSVLTLVPEANLGLFASYNTMSGAGATLELERVFLEHYFPARLPTITPPADAQERNRRYVGKYRPLRHSYTKVEKPFVALAELNVAAMPDGTLRFANPLNRVPAYWTEVGDGVFRKTDEELYIAFKGNRDGYTTSLIGSLPPPIVAERISWYEGGGLHGLLILLSVVLFVSMLVSAIRQRHADRLGPTGLRYARPVLALAGALLIAFVIAMIIALSGGLEELIFAYPPAFYVALALPLLALLPTAAAVVYTVWLWRKRAWSAGGRALYTVAMLATLAFLSMLNYWNLLGYRLG